ncbi:metal ABC transporter permease [Candidatus Peregrinibacteria bacterium HGW-Peregrinibacteria-1]|jgi:manganese/zinc/iron transport system permease protein|nr:MAG: metal ABC transporter permease [Candidatus Peregrinibacteria bacterium HGW-Peregrinibacteria-1]
MSILIIVFLAAISCSLLGALVFLRREAMLVDAISHAVLPGIVVAFLIVSSLSSPFFMVFAFLFAFLAVMIMKFLATRIRVSKESVIGIVFTAFFAIGVLMISRVAGNVHLDQDAVIYGSVEFAGFNRLELFGVDLGPRAIWSLGVAVLLNFGFVTLFYKELKTMIFDEKFAVSIGMPVRFLNFMILFLVTLTAVVAFEVMGSIMVLGLFALPAAGGYLLSRSLMGVLVYAVLMGLVGSLLGFWWAFAGDLSIGGAVITVLGGIFVMIWGLLRFMLWFRKG